MEAVTSKPGTGIKPLSQKKKTKRFSGKLSEGSGSSTKESNSFLPGLMGLAF
jgi:hypothetical protein